MGRPLRTAGAGIHHVVNRGVAHQPIFFEVSDRVEFLRLLGVAHERFGIRVHAYALMTNHYHMVVECPDGGLSEAMHLIGSVFVRHVNERARRDGPLFKDRYYAKPVTTDEYLVRLVNYVHRNPLAIVDEDHVLDYQWSSLRVYARARRRPEWLRTDLVSDLYGGDDAVVAMATGSTSPPPMAANLADLLSLVELMVDEHVDERSHRGAVRTLSVGLLDRVDVGTARSLYDHLAFPSANAERIARCRTRQRISGDPALSMALGAVLAVLGFQYVPGT